MIPVTQYPHWQSVEGAYISSTSSPSAKTHPEPHNMHRRKTQKASRSATVPPRESYRHAYSATYLDEVDLVLSAERLDKLGVGGLIAAGGEDAQESLHTRQRGNPCQQPRNRSEWEGGCARVHEEPRKRDLLRFSLAGWSMSSARLSLDWGDNSLILEISFCASIGLSLIHI